MGTGIGTLSTLGIGGGTLSVPLLVYCNVPIHQAVGTSAACGLPIALAGAIGFLGAGWGEVGLPAGSSGYPYWPTVAAVVAGSAFLAPLRRAPRPCPAGRDPASGVRALIGLRMVESGLDQAARPGTGLSNPVSGQDKEVGGDYASAGVAVSAAPVTDSTKWRTVSASAWKGLGSMNACFWVSSLDFTIPPVVAERPSISTMGPPIPTLDTGPPATELHRLKLEMNRHTLPPQSAYGPA